MDIGGALMLADFDTHRDHRLALARLPMMLPAWSAHIDPREERPHRSARLRFTGDDGRHFAAYAAHTADTPIAP
ncbi:hypothetical protein [Streptomyces sp. NBC_00145]|uniref:hypothetical protein n=1 Tax=Streptomyces sp. NBC_00145 TaxID=2975666 RepID=UPI002E17CE43